MTPLVFLDTETDGVHPGRKPYEIAVIRRDDNGEHTYHAFVDIDLSTADPAGLRVGGFYERHPLGIYLASRDRQGPPPAPPSPCYDTRDTYVSVETAAVAVAQMTHGAHIVGAVPNFDTEVLAALLRQHGLTPAWHYHVQDVETLAAGFLRARGETVEYPYRSDEISRRVGVEPPSEAERHTALGDARWAMRMWDAVMSDA